MTHDPDDTPAAQLDRYLANVEERPRYQPKPVRWWHHLLAAAVLAGLFAVCVWQVGRAFRAW
ncbi:hypothetical protein [Methylorubrum zatmanii]|uniref:DUF3094 domain-containing protein n=1 Tax=Methylorubrum zatmanii TaxID=29429 RepID=A0ABW1WTF2_9HYPH|nr:hypothetical protein [Methylorubrum zatmanii]MBD8908076.1 hypothetical protein [Methylorubrum zatmanii]